MYVRGSLHAEPMSHTTPISHSRLMYSLERMISLRTDLLLQRPGGHQPSATMTVIAPIDRCIGEPLGQQSPHLQLSDHTGEHCAYKVEATASGVPANFLILPTTSSLSHIVPRWGVRLSACGRLKGKPIRYDDESCSYSSHRKKPR
jgi:hypothetical protein